MPKMSRAVENPHLKTFDSHSNSHVSTDSKDCFQDVGILLPPPREYYCVSFESKDFLEPESKTSGDLNVSLQHEIPLAQSLPPPKTKDKHPDSSNEDRCALDDEVPFFMFRPIREPVCEVPSPPPADAWFQSKDTHMVMHPDFKNYCYSLDDEVAFFISPCDVPLPPSPPLTEKKCLASVKHEMSDLMPLSLPEYIPLSPSPPPADAWFQSKDTHKVVYPDFKNDCSSLDDEVAFFISPCDVPLPPRPPTAELGHCRKHRYPSVSSVDDEYIPRSPSPPPAENKYVFFPYPDDKRSDLMPRSLPEYIPLSPSPPPVGDSSNYRKHLNSAFTERPHSVTAHEVSPHPPDEIPHLPEKRYFHLSTVAFPCFDD